MDPRNDPEAPSSYGSGSLWAGQFYQSGAISFWKQALATGDTVTLSKDDKQYEFGKIVNPVKLIEALRAK